MSNPNEVFFLGKGIGEDIVTGRVKRVNKEDTSDQEKVDLNNLIERSSQTKDTDILLLDDLTNLDYLLLLESRGVISKSGGATSHAAIILREMNKPSVIGLGDDINNLKDGNLIILNPKEDKVILIDEQKTDRKN